MKVRPIRAADIEALHRLVAEMQDYEREIEARLLEGSAMKRAYTEAMLSRCALYSGLVLMAELGSEIVGFAAVQGKVPSEELDEPPGTYALVSDLAVTAACRGQGLGRALLAAAEDHARKLGAREIRIEVLAGNEVADGFYRSAGFRPYLSVLSKPLADGG